MPDRGQAAVASRLALSSREAKAQHASFERGLNKNTNGLIRQYLPKSKAFTDITSKEIRAVMDKLNNRPRKCLGMKTTNQVFFRINPPVALAS